MGLPGGGGVVPVAGCKGWKGCGRGKRQQGNQTAEDVRPMPRNQSKPQKPDRPCAPKNQIAARSASRKWESAMPFGYLPELRQTKVPESS
jgi:hypothetical protein